MFASSAMPCLSHFVKIMMNPGMDETPDGEQPLDRDHPT
jgi:hypothetical protein